MEEYEYEIKYVKGKENKVADCLFRPFPITTEILQQATKNAGITDKSEELDGKPVSEDQLPNIGIFNKSVITENKGFSN